MDQNIVGFVWCRTFYTIPASKQHLGKPIWATGLTDKSIIPYFHPV